MAKKKQLHEQEEFFVLNAEKVDVNKTVHVEITDLTKMIDEKKKKSFCSPEFKVGDTSLMVEVDPFRQDYIAVYLCNEGEKEVTATYMIKHASGVEISSKEEVIGSCSSANGFDILSHKAYKEWAKDHGDVLKVEVNITLHVDHVQAQWKVVKDDSFVEVISVFNNNKLFSDFAILSKEGKEFPCHRIILSSQSSAMMVMMTTDMKEKKEGLMKLEYNEEVVKNFVDYFYTRTVPKEVLKQNLDNFMTLSELYDLAPLKLQTEEVAAEIMSTDNMIEMFVLADLHNAENLVRASELFIKKNRDKLPELGLSNYPPNVVNKVLRLLA